MRFFTGAFLLGFGLLLVPQSADAHPPGYSQNPNDRDGDGYRDDRYRRGGYRDNGRYGNGQYGSGQYGYNQDPGAVVSRAMSNLNRAMNSRTDGHEENHFRQAMNGLQDFQARWAQGRFDQGRLDRAIEDISHLVNANQVRGRDRNMLSQDLAALRNLRATGGGNYRNGGGYNNPYRY